MMILFFGFLFFSSVLGGYAPTNVQRPYDFMLTYPEWRAKDTWRVSSSGQIMVANRAFNEHEVRVPATQIYEARQSALAMLEGALPHTPLHNLANRLRGFQDGVRGTFEVEGELRWREMTVDCLYRLALIKLPGIFSLGLHVPVIDAGMRGVTWKNCTEQRTLQDEMVRSLLVSDEKSLAAFVKNNGDLTLGQTRRTGLGNIAALLYWQGFFAQHHGRLREVLLQLRVGIELPTAHRVDADTVFDIDFGHQGSAAVPLGAGLRLELSEGVRVGMDVGATLIVRRLQEWRLKTSWAQTSHLLLTRGLATREYGPEWRFTLYGQAVLGSTGLTGSVGYQFFKHTDSTLYPQSDTMSASLINSAPAIDASESHNLLFSATYKPPFARPWRIAPEAGLTLTVPFSGKQIMSGIMARASFGVAF